MSSDKLIIKVKEYLKFTQEYYKKFGTATGNGMYHQSSLTCGAILAKINEFEKGEI